MMIVMFVADEDDDAANDIADLKTETEMPNFRLQFQVFFFKFSYSANSRSKLKTASFLIKS